MNANPGKWTKVGAVADVPKRGARRIEAGNRTIAIFRTQDDEIYALEDKCPHKGGQLSQGIVHDNCVTCPLHNWVISLATGTAQGADDGHTLTCPVRVSDGNIFIDLSALANGR
ncbi:MAG: nitrite reductase small subunit NirD [Hyphomicrobiaceae bacterium]